jgi:enoyl-CoA hydratase/carnithine racemase
VIQMSVSRQPEYECLHVEVDGGVMTITIDNPPVNLFDVALARDLTDLIDQLETDEATRVCIFKSADPDVFIAHYDLALLLDEPRDDVPVAPGGFNKLMERFRYLSQVSIGQIEGVARGGGSEFLLSLDLRFAALGRALIGQPEVALGILPAGGGTQRLTRLVGRSRALEICLGCEDMPADLAEQYGYVNRSFPAEELEGFVIGLAKRIASYPASAIALTKAAINAADQHSMDGYVSEATSLALAKRDGIAHRRMAQTLKLGGQTRDGELGFQEILGRLDA